MPSAERRAHEAKKDAEASAKRHAKGLPVAKEELTRLRTLAERYYVDVVHRFETQHRFETR